MTGSLKYKVNDHVSLTVSDEIDTTRMTWNHSEPLPFGVAVDIQL